jgi:cation-transporting ATPase E
MLPDPIDPSLPPGLSEAEAARRAAAGQANAAPPATGRTYWDIARENIFTFINGVLFFLGLTLTLLGRPGDAVLSIGVISLNVLVSVVQEIRAKRILDQIALLTRPTATVRRDGRERIIPPEQIVVGDMLVARPGDQILVDGTLRVGRMQADEALLTGESDLALKHTGDPVLSGSFCVTGGGLYQAEQVGAHSFANRLTAGARSFRRVQTPLQREINLIIRLMLVVVVYLEFLVSVRAIVQQIEVLQTVQNSTLIAGLVPNGLLLSISVAYALGAVRIARRGALVQQANSIESLSYVDVLCLDKTGTLTMNQLSLHGVYPYQASQAAFENALGNFVHSQTTGNKTSAAIAAGLPGRRLRLRMEAPFASVRKWSAIAVDPPPVETQDFASLHPTQNLASLPISPGTYTLGAPEILHAYLDPSEDHDPLMRRAVELAGQGLRVLLFAYHPDPGGLQGDPDAPVLPFGMIPLGLAALQDELRPQAAETLAAFKQAGVTVKIISGDSPETVAALARRLGLKDDPRLFSGPQLDQLSEDGLAEAARSGDIFGRITPQQKEALVRALRDSGSYVAMIGDGVNDVLSLKQANLGIAMQSGSQATRAAADLILLHDSFTVLPRVVEEGQRIINGMQDVFRLYLTRILTVSLVIVSALVIGEFPLALRQGSLVTLLGVGIPSVLLAYWARPSPVPKQRLLRRLFHFVVPAALITSIVALVLFYTALMLHFSDAVGEDAVQPITVRGVLQAYTAVIPLAQTILVNFLALCGIFIIVFAEPPSDWWTGGDELSPDRRPALLAVGMIAVILLINLFAPLRALFSLQPLGWLDAVAVAGALLVWLLSLRAIWRSRMFERFLIIAERNEPNGV